ncbi:hypothetical protein LUX39_30150 [Actinomadura madurae]|nr:hypothetical protein [Actinomadura madurae]MCP9952083.1 hypothetical protein [Actinomadura madurae]MCQ0007173.1 hypothetical protein [Actinomadura madurae]MCQ0017518.1 hypothetical protein [Actinomadura madurae]
MTAYSRQPSQCRTRSPGRGPASGGAETTSPIAAPNSGSPGRSGGNGVPSTPPPIRVRTAGKTWKKRLRTSTSPSSGTGTGTSTTAKCSGLGSPSGRAASWTMREVGGMGRS